MLRADRREILPIARVQWQKAPPQQTEVRKKKLSSQRKLIKGPKLDWELGDQSPYGRYDTTDCESDENGQSGSDGTEDESDDEARTGPSGQSTDWYVSDYRAKPESSGSEKGCLERKRGGLRWKERTSEQYACHLSFTSISIVSNGWVSEGPLLNL